jgi:hypothetical protein
LTFNGIHGLISQKIKLFITTAVRTSNPTLYIKFSFLFYSALSRVERWTVDWLMNDELRRSVTKRPWPNPCIIRAFVYRRWGRPRKTCHCNLCLGRDWKRTPPEYKFKITVTPSISII